MLKNSDTDLIRTLARNGFGGLYAEEIILRSGLDKNRAASTLSRDEIEKIDSAINELFKPLSDLKFNPHIIKNGEGDVSPLNSWCTVIGRGVLEPSRGRQTILQFNIQGGSEGP